MSKISVKQWGAAIMVASVMLGARVDAAESSAATLVPDDAVAVISFPSFPAAKEAFLNDPLVKLFSDPAMKRYVDGVKETFEEKVLKGLEEELGFPVTEYTSLLNGQLTVALFAEPGRGGRPAVNFLVAMDAGEKGAAMKEKLEDARERYLGEGLTPKPVTIANQSFFRIDPVDGNASDAPVDVPTSFYWGQVDSLLLLGTSEKVLGRTLGTSDAVSSLGDNPAFRRIHGSRFRDSYGYGWLNFARIYQLVEPMIENADRQMARNANPLIPKPSHIADVLGLGGLEGLSFNLASQDDGTMIEFTMAIPEEKRTGVFGLMALEEKESTPPQWVPADVIRFNRTRFNLAKMWENLEGMVKELVPPAAGIMELYLGGLGKDRDPNFNFRESFFGNLGDDIITVGLSPRGKEIQDLTMPPSLTLLGSPDPQALTDSLVILTGLIPGGGGALKQREFMGRKLYSFSVPGLPIGGFGVAGGEGMPEAGIHLVADEDYLVFSMDEQSVEDYLRGPKASQKSLRQVGGIGKAKSALGAETLTSFRYDNASALIRGVWDIWRANGADAANQFGLGALGGNPMNDLGALANFEDLPPFERVAKYFHYSVGGASKDAQYMSFRWFRPTPPGL